MAIPFKNPDPNYRLIYNTERIALNRHFTHRKVPKTSNGKVLIATWNIANIGAQKRRDTALKLIAHILKRFELIAVQEVNDNFDAFLKVIGYLGNSYDYIMNDTAGNAERLAFLYKKGKVSPLNLFGELALRRRVFPKRTVNVEYTENGEPKVQKFKNLKFQPFDRNPFIGSFKVGNLDFVLVNVHLYFGAFGNSTQESKRKKYARRVLEIFALSKWSRDKLKSNNTYDKDIILMGDMNIPIMSEKNSAYKALVQFGMVPLKHMTKTGFTNIANDKTYDQVAFAPKSKMQQKILNYGVFDFDKAVFKDVWETLTLQMSVKKAIPKFNKYVKHHISDHRPIWMELDIS